MAEYVEKRPTFSKEPFNDEDDELIDVVSDNESSFSTEDANDVETESVI